MSKTRTFQVTVSDDDGDGVWVAFDDFSIQYGEGRDPVHALFDWLRSVDAHWRELKKDKDNLGPSMKRNLDAIARVLSKDTE